MERGLIMKPRVFVSSTYYDLKYIRNNIDNYITAFGFEPVLFESGSVFFQHNEKMDISCYCEVKLCNMMILIIGGRYGAPVSNEKQDDFINKYEDEYVSITRNEYRTAINENIPVYIFIDKSVYVEYRTYLENKSFIKTEGSQGFKFAYVDSLNVFKFIDEVHQKAIYTFEKFEDIELQLTAQWSGMFYDYLSMLKENAKDNKLLNSIDELKDVSERINSMVDEVAKTLLTKDGKYDKLAEEQNIKTIKFYTKKLLDNLKFGRLVDINKNDAFELSELIIDKIINGSLFVDGENRVDSVKFFLYDLVNEEINSINDYFKSINSDYEITRFEVFEVIQVYNEKIYPIIKDYNNMTTVFKQSLEEAILKEYSLPF